MNKQEFEKLRALAARAAEPCGREYGSGVIRVRRKQEFARALTPQVVLGLLARNELLEARLARLQEKCAGLEAEADWLADMCREFCVNKLACRACPLSSGPCPEGSGLALGFQKREILDWRKAARIQRKDS